MQWYNVSVETVQSSDEFRPEQNPRRGELIAWSTALLVGFAWLYISLNNQVVPKTIPFLAIILLMTSLSISLGNWMDRQTLIQLSATGVAFKNGLRNVRLQWDEINQIRVLATRWGSKVQVFGEAAFFEFRTLGEVKLMGNFTGKIGFAEGNAIMHQIISKSGLQIVEDQGEVYYYARQ